MLEHDLYLGPKIELLFYNLDTSNISFTYLENIDMKM